MADRHNPSDLRAASDPVKTELAIEASKVRSVLDEPITRKRFLIEQVMVDALEHNSHPSIWVVAEAVATTAMANDWDLDEVKTRGEWQQEAKEMLSAF
jgi:hypothetical protein